MSATSVLLISRATTLTEAVAAIAAAAGVDLVCVADDSDIRRRWAGASAVLVGDDLASLIMAMALPMRKAVYVVAGDAAEAVRWSVPLGAMGLVLPTQSGMLTSVLEGLAGPAESNAVVLRVLGGSGGVGASTLAAAVAQRAARSRHSSALVELDRHGGGIDLFFGAEDAPGWRWPDLASATGHIGSLAGRLPNVSGVDLVSVGGWRSERPSSGGLPEPMAVQAVLASLSRSHELVVLDGGEPGSSSPETRLLVVAAGVRSVLAGRSLVKAEALQDALLVVRRGPAWRLESGQVAEALGLGCVGVIDHDRRLPRGLEVGDPPGRTGGRFARQVDAILAQVLPAESAGRAAA